jgi:hypothetical protein
MSNFNPAAGQIVADELRTAFNSLDVSVHDSARLMTTFVEAITGTDLPPARAQHALRALTQSISKAVESRGEMINAQRALIAIKGSSNLDVYDFGCFMGAAITEPARADLAA